MIKQELLDKIRRISIITSKMVREVFAGQYQSVFKGRGMEFDAVREYQPGDEIRSIDWNVTARTGRLQVKKFIEERELTVMLLLDGSSSCRFGSKRQLKSELAAEICSVLAFSAIHNQDKVGLIIFTDKIEKVIPPRKGTNHVLRLVREAIAFEPQGRGTELVRALDYFNMITHRKTVCFLLSDFLIKDYEKTLTIANQRHDMIAIRIIDPRETELPGVGLISMDDAETGEQLLVDTSAPFRKDYRERSLQRLNQQQRFFNSIGIDNIDVYTDTPYIDSLIKFFKVRERRQRRGY
ncbi:MAG: DUF58 domain-containing protein [Candidatus Omnitrophica bacterium]|nr:DUF58 domain-containing protein [Candidatus Omnitrophota bacterium]